MLQNTSNFQEGDLHSVITIDDHSFELRYGYCDERDRNYGEPYILYPDLKSKPVFTQDGYRIVAALQSTCSHYAAPDTEEWEDCCYTCSYYSNPQAEIGICRCRQMSRSTMNEPEGEV